MTPENLVWLIPLPPLLAFFIIVLFTHKNKALSHGVAIGLMGLSWMLSWGVFFNVLGLPRFGEEVLNSVVDWLPFGSAAVANTATLQLGVLVDPLTAVMLFFVPLICLLIFIYSVGYSNWGKPVDPHDRPGQPPHRGIEPMYSRFFAFLSLFAFAMLLLVVADNLLLMFAGWEVMGLCSYLLIGFWYARDYPNPKQTTPRQAAVKAFMVTRVGDVLMLLGISYLYAQTGTLSFREIMYAHEGEWLTRLAETPSFIAGLSAASLIGLLLFSGTVGKSAQFPLHVWLPDAMEGPTPVSAMIHAATMVSAGVYAMIRMFPLLSAGWKPGLPLTVPMMALAVIGSFTALFAATIAVSQSDIKKVLAYSTISQLGFMLAALGVGAYVAAAFHLMTHAFFKALLFLGSGSVIHGMEHGEQHAHDHHGAAQHANHAAHAKPAHSAPDGPAGLDPQNMFQMGGLGRKMPVTFWTFVIGGLALSGFPLITAGFWSKDEIFAETWAGAPVVFIVLALAALLTAFYTMRQISLTFLGRPRTAAAEHASENKWTMTLPLAALAVFAVAAGWVGIPNDFLGLNLGHINRFHGLVGRALLEEPEALAFSFVPLAASLVAALGGLLLGWWVYRRGPAEADDPLIKVLGPIHPVLKNKYYMDELYAFLFVRPVRWLAEVAVSLWIDRRLIDGVLHWIGRVSLQFGDGLRTEIDNRLITGAGDLTGRSVKNAGQSARFVQAGKVQEYLLLALSMMIVAGILLFLRIQGR
jgi:NADH-quinone oxidoreductase subunit L